jgi:hypothetical protein
MDPVPPTTLLPYSARFFPVSGRSQRSITPTTSVMPFSLATLRIARISGPSVSHTGTEDAWYRPNHVRPSGVREPILAPKSSPRG